jgi:hypothetical protein
MDDSDEGRLNPSKAAGQQPRASSRAEAFFAGQGEFSRPIKKDVGRPEQSDRSIDATSRIRSDAEQRKEVVEFMARYGIP